MYILYNIVLDTTYRVTQNVVLTRQYNERGFIKMFLNLMGNKLKPNEVNDALSEILESIQALDKKFETVNDASEISYSNTTSGLSATNVQGAIDEVVTDIATYPIITSNANGISYKFASGLLICTKSIAQNVSDTDWTVWGETLYTATITGGSWATNFINTPQVSVTNDSVDGGFTIGDVKGVSTTGLTSVQIIRPNAPTLVAGNISIIAIGKWK